MSFDPRQDQGHADADAELPLAALRAAWNDVTPPEPCDDLADADALTQRCVGYLRTAWHAQTPPAASAGDFRSRLRFRRRRALARRALLVAAALLLVSLPFVLSVVLHTGDPAEPDAVEQVADASGPFEPERQPDRQAASPAPEAPRIAAVTSDHVELVSGPVRLVLLTPGGGAPRTLETRTPSTDGGTPR